MHPLFIGRLRPLLYASVWVGIAFGLSFLLARLEARPFPAALVFLGPITLIYGSVCLSAWWVCKAHPIGTTPAPRLIVTLLGASAQAAAAWVALGAVWGGVLARLGLPGAPEAPVRDLAFLGGAGVLLYAESLAIHYVLLALETARSIERRLLESQVSAREAELRALRAQLNPHFLFNSLNSISALTGPDAEGARRMCQSLGDFLRTSLALGARDRVALAEELALAERYLSIEQVRFGARLGFEKHATPEAERCLVPPLLVQPLVENAVKHGVADRVEGGVVRIEARRRGEHLEITVENPRDPDAPPRRGHGLGLENVRRRLDALDPRGTRLDVQQDPDRFRVALILPAVEAGDAAAPPAPPVPVPRTAPAVQPAPEAAAGGPA